MGSRYTPVIQTTETHSDMDWKKPTHREERHKAALPHPLLCELVLSRALAFLCLPCKNPPMLCVSEMCVCVQPDQIGGGPGRRQSSGDPRGSLLLLTQRTVSFWTNAPRACERPAEKRREGHGGGGSCVLSLLMTLLTRRSAADTSFHPLLLSPVSLSFTSLCWIWTTNGLYIQKQRRF